MKKLRNITFQEFISTYGKNGNIILLEFKLEVTEAAKP